MATIEEVNNYWKQLDIEKVIMDTVEQNAELMLELNKKQLKEGFDSEGKRLREYKSSLYAEVKHRMNPVPGFGNPDLYKTGSFFLEFTLRVTGKKKFFMYSQDDKYYRLVKDYGENIFGLGTDKRTELIDGGFRSDLQNKVKAEVRL